VPSFHRKNPKIIQLQILTALLALIFVLILVADANSFKQFIFQLANGLAAILEVVTDLIVCLLEMFATVVLLIFDIL
jgi:high-affinity K+ transport system ATPase subunit B